MSTTATIFFDDYEEMIIDEAAKEFNLSRMKSVKKIVLQWKAQRDKIKTQVKE